MIIRELVSRVRAKARRHLLDALDERGLVRGMRIEFERPGHCSLREFEEVMPGPGEVLLETLLSASNLGTERAFYLGRENIPIVYPHAPGYSQVGRVVVTGPSAGLQVGEIVFASGPHASIYLSSAQRVVRVPPGVALEAAAMTLMGFVALHGVRSAEIAPGERVVVLGCGLIGQFAAQLAQLAGGKVVASATSPERLKVAQACGVRDVLDARNERDALARLEAEVVIEATGDPEAVHDAALAAGKHARVVLLGSSRGMSRDLDLGTWRTKQLTMIGGHVDSVPVLNAIPGSWSRVRGYRTFLDLLAQRRLVTDPLISRRVTPSEASRVYAELARPNDKSLGVLFDWSLPGPWTARTEAVSPLRIAVAGVRRMARRAAAPAPTFMQRRSDGRVLRFGLIGCGEIAAESAAALRAASNATITFTADRHVDLARSLAAGTGARYSESVEKLLTAPEVDAVLISTPHHLHASFAIQAAEAGKHVVVEKPMATTLGDCDRMIEAARRAGVALSVCYCQRYDPRVQRAKRLLQQGLIGNILGTRIAFGQLRAPEYWKGGLTGRVASDWRGRLETAGGGVLIMNACHILDYMGWLVGSGVTEVTALTANFSRLTEVEDSVSMSYRYANGAIGTLDATTGMVGPHLYEQSLRGEEGQLVIAPALRFWSRRTVDGYESSRWHTVRGLPRFAERQHFFEAFAGAVLDERAVPITPEEARFVQATIGAAYLSAAEQRAVCVQGDGGFSPKDGSK
jgi:2-desacetyl-2-hydroxyethyl bacteriochlorophyllide A dehydrogenase